MLDFPDNPSEVPNAIDPLEPPLTFISVQDNVPETFGAETITDVNWKASQPISKNPSMRVACEGLKLLKRLANTVNVGDKLPWVIDQIL
jgi:hypothetical protein